MTRSSGRSVWLLPAIVTLLVAGLGVAVNLATALKSSWIAWAVVVALSVTIALITGTLEWRKTQEPDPLSAMTSLASELGLTSNSWGLKLRKVETDGKLMTVTEIYTDELARQSLRDDSGGDEGDDDR
jgi:prepilin signal peptidase PulO-like enzyme (type II secretory pathway)